MAARLRGSRASQRGLSGKTNQKNTAASRGMIPPARRSARQPWSGRMSDAKIPASTIPSGTNSSENATAKARRRCGVNSATSVAQFGISAPNPRPANSRATANTGTLGDNAVARSITPMSMIGQMIPRRRPMRSPSQPPPAFPAATPISPTASGHANGSRGRPHAFINDGMDRLVS